MDRIIDAYRIAERVLRGESGAYAVKWNSRVREQFIKWLESEVKTRDYILDCTRYLDRYVKRVEEPSDVVEFFSRCERGKPHLVKAFRSLVKFHCIVLGFPESIANALLKPVPKAKTGVDYREVSEEAVVETFKVLRGLPESLQKYRLLWTVILDGGVRLSHAVQFLASLLAKGKGRKVSTTGLAYLASLIKGLTISGRIPGTLGLATTHIVLKQYEQHV